MSEFRDRTRGARRAPGVARHGRLKRSNPGLLLLKIVGATLAVLLFSGASVAAITTWRLGSQITANSVELIGETDGPPPQIGKIPGGFNLLIVGSDSRENSQGIGGTTEDDSGVLNDVNILLHVSEDQTNAVAISFPRDLLVPIPDCVDEDGYTKPYSTEPINVSLFYGGLSCAVYTVETLTGLDVQFAGLIEFVGVISMSDAVGGVDVCIDGPVVDDYSGINLPTAGNWTLQGWNALAFLRSRHGVGDGSDLTRISSQQVFLSSLVRKLKSEDTLGDVGKLIRLANAAAANLQLSTSLANIDTMVSIALALKDIPLERVTFVQYPGTTGHEDGKVHPDEYSAGVMFDYIRADQPFVLSQVGDDSGSMVDPNAPAPDPTATPVDNTGLPVLEGVTGQTAADYTCSVSNY